MSGVLPIILAFSAALLWALNTHVQRKGLDDTDPVTGGFLSVAATAAMCWLAAPFALDPSWWHSGAALLFLAMGLFFPALGQTLQVVAISRVGPSLTASLGGLTPVFAVMLGVAVLGETLTLPVAIGLGIIFAAIVIAGWSPKGVKRGWPLWALLLPFGAALARGIAQPGLKLGLSEVPSPYFALLCASSVSTVVLAVFLLYRRSRGLTRWGPGAAWFGLGGAVNGAGIFALNAALGLGTVSLVSPLASTVPLWVLLMGAFVFRNETLGRKHLLVAVLMVTGSVLIVST